MSQALIPRQVAFRIGLAAKQLEGISTSQLVGTLLDLTGGTLTLEALEQVGAQKLRDELKKTAPVSRSAISRVIFQLRKGALPLEQHGELVPRDNSPLKEAHLLVAFASNEGRWLDGSFSRCKRFLIYQIGSEDSRLADVRYPARPTCPGSSASFDNLGLRVDLLSDCRILYTLSVGTPATARLVRARVHAVRWARPIPCSHVVRRLQRVMSTAPPPWMKKALQGSSGQDSSSELANSSEKASGHAPPCLNRGTPWKNSKLQKF